MGVVAQFCAEAHFFLLFPFLFSLWIVNTVLGTVHTDFLLQRMDISFFFNLVHQLSEVENNLSDGLVAYWLSQVPAVTSGPWSSHWSWLTDVSFLSRGSHHSSWSLSRKSHCKNQARPQSLWLAAHLLLAQWDQQHLLPRSLLWLPGTTRATLRILELHQHLLRLRGCIVLQLIQEDR